MPQCGRHHRQFAPPRTGRRIPSVFWWGALAVCIVFASVGLRGDADSQEEIENEPLAGIQIEGNYTISNSEIAKHIKSRPGRPLSVKQVKDDMDSLYRTKWFAIIRDPKILHTDNGPVLLISVVEKPIVRSVEYLGLKKPNSFQRAAIEVGLARDEIDKLAALTGLKKGSPYDIAANTDCARRIEQMYHEKGYAFATVELEKGNRREDRDVVFRINKGPKVKVRKVDFIGNKDFSDGVLGLKLQTKKQFVGLFGGKYDPNSIPNDKQSITEYYHSLGYFDFEIDHEIAFSDDKSKVYLKYYVTEGDRYKIRSMSVEGNEIFSEENLNSEMTVKAGDHFNSKSLGKDVEKIKEKYGELGRLFAKVDAVPVFQEEPGFVDLVFRIDEDQVYRIRDWRYHFEGDHPHSMVTLPRNIARAQPGDLADPKKIKATQRAIDGSGYFEGSQGGGQGPGSRMEITPVQEDWLQTPGVQIARGQDSAGPGYSNLDDPNAGVIPVQARGPMPPPQRYLNDNSPQGDPLIPSIRDPDPNIWENLPPPQYIDIDTYLSDARTGRLMFGVGVNSNAGLIGNIVFSENNFNLFRPPRSWADIWEGNAWRGAGQKFRIEALPGTQVSRYMVDWQNPYLFDSDYNLGVSGFYFNRYYRNWTEQRLGGRVRIGRQFTQQWSAAVALRLENVDLFNPSIPTPSILQQSVGSNFLSTVQAQLIHDTRDAAFLPGSGHYIAGTAEQAFAQYTYTHLDVEGRQYFTPYQRPDGAGRHTLMFRGELGWTGNSTPIFERFYAGGFQSFRGFAFRGVSPMDTGVLVGGTFLTLGTVEYMMPILANEMVKVVAFSDFGTVDNSVDLKNFRASVGTGLRLTVPMMGPVPIALDFAVPIVHENTDIQQVFSFYVGANW